MVKRKSYDPENQLNPFLDLNENEFEDLCRDFFAKSNEVTHTRRLFGKGYKQYGGDVLIQVSGSDRSHVAQCKHYPLAAFSRQDIEGAVDLFVSYLESHWGKSNITRFYLIVARPITTFDQETTIQEQRTRLFDLGIEFVYLDSTALKNELKIHRDLVREYLGEYWERICPPDREAIKAASEGGFIGDSIAGRLLNRDYEQMSDRFSEAIEVNLEPIRELARTGNQADALAQLAEIKADSFDYLKGRTRAEILSLEIRLELPIKMDAKSARRTLEQIKIEDPEFQILYLDALITSYESGLKTALEKLTFCPDTATFNLKLTFLINTADLNSAEREYDTESERLKYDAETKRLYAAVLLGLGKIKEAEKLIEEVYAEKPGWEGVLMVKAIIYYTASLALSATVEFDKNPPAFPHPQPWHLVKTDDESQRKRREAAEIFKAALSDKERELENRRVLETWYLACMADDPFKQAEASEYCQSLLQNDPAHPYALIWAINRNFEVNYTASENFLAERFAAAKDFTVKDLNEALILLPLYLRSNKFNKAAGHLEKIKPSLNKTGNEKLAEYWHCQIEIARSDGAFFNAQFLKKIADAELRRSLHMRALVTRYRKDPNRGSQRALIRGLLKQYRRFGDGLALFNYCILCQEQKKWHEIVFYAKNLLDLVQTPDAVRMVADAFYKEKQPEKTLQILDEFKHVFPAGRLTVYLSRLKSYALLISGHVVQAAHEAKGLYERDKSAENLLALIETARRTDDFFSINQAVEQMPKLDDLTPRQQLKISDLLSSYNPELASAMWRTAKSKVSEGEDVLNALYFHGQKLGLWDEAETLLPEILRADRPTSSQIISISTEEFNDWFNSRTSELQEIEDLYQTGNYPTHIYCEMRNEPISEIFHVQSQQNLDIENISQKRKIMTRNAARPERLAEVFPARESWHLHFDLTSLLLAHELDLFESLEKAAPIFVSSEVIPFINAEIEAFQNSSFDAIAPIKAILLGLDSSICKRLAVFRNITVEEREQYEELLTDLSEKDLQLMLQAKQEDAALVVTLPLKKANTDEVIELPDEFAGNTFDWTDIARALLATDALTATQKFDAEEKLKNKNLHFHPAKLELGTPLLMIGNAAFKLAEMGLFEAACRIFPVMIDERSESVLREDVRRFEKQQAVIKWLESLKERLKKGFETGVYKGISHKRLKEEVLSDEERQTGLDYRERSIREILRLIPSEDVVNAAAVIDDRNLSRHASVEGTIPIFTIYEILDYLRTRKFLGENAYFDILMRLRERNFRYLPVKSEEILHHFRREVPEPSLDDSRFKRSHELSALRRYLSDCLLDDRLLKRPDTSQSPAGADRPGDLRFVLRSERAVIEAIGQAWLDAESIEQARNHADSLLFDFFIGSFNLRHFFEDFPALEAGAYNLASDFVSLSFQGVGLLTADLLYPEERLERAAAFFDWVGLIFDAKFRRNPQIIEHAVRNIVNILILTFAGLPEEKSASELEKAQRAALFLLYARFVNFLPDVVRRRLFEMDELWKHTPLPKPEAVVTVENKNFGAKALWRAVAESLDGKPATIPLQNDPNQIFTVTREDREEGALSVKLTGDQGSFSTMTGNFIGIQLPNKADRKNFLNGLPEVFDCAEQEMSEAVELISSMSLPAERAAAYNQWATTSMQLAYQTLSDEIGERKSFIWRGIIDMPIQSLPKHFRLAPVSDDVDFNPESEFDRAAEQLLREEGLEIALERLCRLPFSLPKILLTELDKLDIPQKKALLEKFQTKWASPVHKLHYLHLVLNLLPEDQEIITSARKIADDLFKPNERGKENKEFEVFKALLDLLAKEFSRSPFTRQWRPTLRLVMAWAHAAELYNLIVPLAENDEGWTSLLEFFNSMRPFWGGEILSFDPDFWGDALNPRFLERESFLALAAGRLFADLTVETNNKIGLPKLLADLCFAEVEGEKVPHFALWRDFSIRNNFARSFWGDENLMPFYSLVSTKNVKFYKPGVLHEYLETVLDKLTEDPQDAKFWLEFTIITHGQALAAGTELETKFIQAVDKIDFPNLWNDKTEAAWFVLSSVAAQNINLPTELQQKIEGWIFWIVERLAEKYPSRFNQRMKDRQQQDQAVLNIIDIAAWMSAVPHDPFASSRNWNRLIERLGRIWPNLYLWLEPFLFRCWIDLPLEQIQGLGRNLLIARATR